MPKKALLIFIGILFTAATAMASDSTRIQITPTFLGQKLVLDFKTLSNPNAKLKIN